MPHPAITRQLARVASGEAVDQPITYFSQNAAMSGTSAYGPLRKSLSIHVEAAAGQNAGVNQIASQDLGVIQACTDAAKTGFLTKIGALV